MDRFIEKLFTKTFPKPEKVSLRNYGVYIVLSIITILILVGVSINTYVFYSVYGLNELVLLGILILSISLFCIVLNYYARHDFSFILIGLAIFVYGLMGTLYYGNDIGFHYFIFAEIFVVLLNPRFSVSVMFVLSLAMFGVYMLFHNFTHNVQLDPNLPNHFLHTINALFSFVALSITSIYYRIYASDLITRLKTSANTDMLTGLMNRRSMLSQLHHLNSMADRYQHHNSLVLIDIDHFKKLNDTYGHNAGDDILKQFSNLIKARLRDSDFIARWGGEEFLILMPFTTLANASLVAEELRNIIDNYDFKLGDRITHITMTAGVADILPNDSINDALTKADKLLYRGKRQGRNVVMTEHDCKIDYSTEFVTTVA